MRLWSAAAVVLVLALLAGRAAAMPSERSCLLAWNAPSNHPNRARLVAAGRSATISLLPVTVGRDTWTRTTTTSTTAAACLLTVAGAATSREIVGRWRLGRVPRWSWRRPAPAWNAPPANVRLLADGRVTKLSRR